MTTEMREYIELVAERTASKVAEKMVERLPCMQFEKRIRAVEFKVLPLRAVWWALGILFAGLINTAFWAFRG